MTPDGRTAAPCGELCPLPGSPPALVDAAESASRTATRLADARSRLLRVGASLDTQRSPAVERARERVAAAADHARASGGMLEAAASTLHRHAAVLHDAQASAQRAIDEHAEALRRETRWYAEVDEARRSTWNIVAVGGGVVGGGVAGGGVAGGGVTGGGMAGEPSVGWSGAARSSAGWSPSGRSTAGRPTGWSDACAVPGDPTQAHLRLATAERELAAARADVAAAAARWRAARDTKDDASRRAAAALSALADVRAVRAVVTAGADPRTLEASGAAARRVVTLLPRAASGGEEEARRELRAELRRILTAHADDPAFWAVFWDGATTQDVYLALGPTVLDPARPLPARLRTALGDGVMAWARTASDPELREFGRDVVVGIGDWPLGLSERSRLAAILLPAELPAVAHAAAGDALDARWRSRADEAAAATGTPGAPTGDALVDATITAPIAVAVLAGYARHPRLALDRLAPAQDTQVAGSVRRWFGWAPSGGWPDGGRAVAGAYAAAVDEGTTSHHRADQRRAAVLVSHATPALATGLTAGPTLDDRASADVARAYEPYLPSVGDATLAQTFARDAEDGPAEPVPAPGIDPDDSLAAGTGLRADVPQPELDAFALRDVIAATSRSPEAAQAWLGTTERYAASMIEVATSGAYDVNSEPRYHLAEQVLTGVGAVTGAMQAETLAAAYDEAETREAVISLASDALGLGTLGRSSAEAVAATATTKGLEFLDTSGPIADARAEVGTVRDQTYTRYVTTIHDLYLAHDLDAGIPLDEAMRRAESTDVAADDDAALHIEGEFRTAFKPMSEPEEGDR
ncbi:hypothetical protein ACQP60_16035 [Isoptericola variabilis]|uniref:hypothetical protein n=1 Tax=Isoptericola variabilis TaxID=139208 RepID=UPI003D1B487D